MNFLLDSSIPPSFTILGSNTVGEPWSTFLRLPSLDIFKSFAVSVENLGLAMLSTVYPAIAATLGKRLNFRRDAARRLPEDLRRPFDVDPEPEGPLNECLSSHPPIIKVVVFQAHVLHQQHSNKPPACQKKRQLSRRDRGGGGPQRRPAPNSCGRRDRYSHCQRRERTNHNHIIRSLKDSYERPVTTK